MASLGVSEPDEVSRSIHDLLELMYRADRIPVNRRPAEPRAPIEDYWRLFGNYLLPVLGGLGVSTFAHLIF